MRQPFRIFKARRKRMEIERKWLIKKLPEQIADEIGAGRYPQHSIIQGYLCTDPVVRVRKDSDQYYLTYKGKGKLSREEYNLPLNAEAFDKLVKKCEGIVLHKDRYEIPIEDNDLVIELDLFHGDYEGLIYAEVEFAAEDEAKSFDAPSWFGREVTYEKGYSNAALSQGSLLARK